VGRWVVCVSLGGS